MFKPKLREYTAKALEERTRRGDDSAAIVDVGHRPTRVTLKSGEELEGAHARLGRRPPGESLVQVARARAAARQPHRVGPDLELPDHPEVYVVGDIARDHRREDRARSCPSSARSRSSRESTPARRSRGAIAGKETEAVRVPATRARWRRSAAARRSCRCSRGRTMTGQGAVSPGAPSISRCCPPNEDRAKAVVDWAWAGFTHQRAGRITVETRVDRRVTRRVDRVDLARWQFATTSLYHFIFVPLTLGLGAARGGDADALAPHGDETWLRLTRFFGTLFLINFAIGVATGLVQEFQFGMNWSVVLELRRRRLRLAARDRGARRVHARGDVHRPLDLRLEPALAAGCTSRRIWLVVARHLAVGATSSWSRTRGCSTRSGYKIARTARRS